MTKALLDAGADPNTTNDNGENLLFIAVLNRNIDAFEYMVAKGGNIYATNKRGATILNCATTNLDEDSHTIKYLLENYPWNINFQDFQGNTIVHYKLLSEVVLLQDYVTFLSCDALYWCRRF